MSSRAPAWVWFVYASFVFYAGLVIYTNRLGPEPIGATFRFTGGRMILQKVDPDTPAARAGLLPEDVITRAAGIPIRSMPGWTAARAQIRIGEPQTIEIERDGVRFQGELLALRRVRGGAILPGSVLAVIIPVKVVGFVLAFLILWYRARDTTALVAAWLIASAASVTAAIMTGMAANVRDLPAPLAVVLVFPFFSNMSMSATLFTFCALFPRRFFRSMWPVVAVWIVVVTLFVTVTLPFYWRVVYRPGELAGGIPEVGFRTALYVFFALVPAALFILLLNYRRLEDVNERRRVRVVVVGFAVSWAAVVPFLYTLNLAAGTTQRQVVSPLLAFPIALLSTAMPASLTYAVLRHRIFDIRVIIRAGLQYAVARYMLVGIAPLMALLLVADLMAHRQQSVGEMLQVRGWIYLGVAALALFAHRKRTTWLNMLDRRFFRERYDAQSLLRTVLDDVREAPDLDAVAPNVAAKIEAALHPEYAALLARRAGMRSYEVIACTPDSAARLNLSAEAKLLGIVRLLQKPVEISTAQTSWLKEQLPHDETQWLRDTHLDLIVPVALEPAPRETLFLLGRKRSEEPYSREDNEFLLSVAAGLRLLLDRTGVVAPSDSSFRECPQCGLCAGSMLSTCPSDSTPLTVVAAPQLLAERYRLERRIGRGGMGSVYAARDTALERSVAAKLIREELVGSPSATRRFQQEARAAAAFTHPNVVAIHDYGVAGARAFLIMELLRGHSLRDEIQQHGPLHALRLLNLFRGVCGAVESAHRRGMVHRDLKPENIFLAQADVGESAKILDFGLVKAMTDETQLTADTAPGAAVGTASYFSPEQWLGETPDASFDCWALAVTIYEALCGHHPFNAANHDELRRRVLAGQYLPCKDEAWEDIFRRAFAVERGQRPASPQALYERCEGALSRAAVLATQR